LNTEENDFNFVVDHALLLIIVTLFETTNIGTRIENVRMKSFRETEIEKLLYVRPYVATSSKVIRRDPLSILFHKPMIRLQVFIVLNALLIVEKRRKGTQFWSECRNTNIASDHVTLNDY
jgi:hypothetical protein